MVTHSSILAWRIPQTEKPGGLQSIYAVFPFSFVSRFFKIFLLIFFDPTGCSGMCCLIPHIREFFKFTPVINF